MWLRGPNSNCCAKPCLCCNSWTKVNTVLYLQLGVRRILEPNSNRAGKGLQKWAASFREIAWEHVHLAVARIFGYVANSKFKICIHVKVWIRIKSEFWDKKKSQPHLKKLPEERHVEEFRKYMKTWRQISLKSL